MSEKTSSVEASSEATPLLPSTKPSTKHGYAAEASNSNASDAATPPLKHSPQLLDGAATDTTDNPSSRLEYIGYGLQAFCSLMFAMADVLARVTQARFHFPPSAQVFCVMCVHTSASLTYLLLFTSLRKTISKLRTRDIWLLLFRGCVGWAMAWTLTLALRYLPSGDAMTIFFTSPVMMIFLARIFLGESITPWGLCASVIGFTGIAILSKSQQAHLHISIYDRVLGNVFGLLAALCSCFVYLSVRVLVTRVHFMASILSMGVCGLVMSALGGGVPTPELVKQNPQGTFCSFLVGIAAFIAQIGLNAGLKFCKASTGYLVRNLEIPFVYLLALWFLNEVPSAMKIFGTALVLLAAILVGLAQTLRTDDT